MAGFKHTIRLVLQQTKETNKLTPIRCFVRYNNTRSVFGSGVSIEPRYWNPKNQEPRQTAALANGEKIKADLLNVKKWITESFDKLTANIGEYPDPIILKNACIDLIKNNGINRDGEKSIKQISLFDYIDRFINDTIIGKRVGANGTKYTSGTIRSYNSAYGVLKRFAEYYRKPALSFADINLEFYYEFKDFAFQVEKLSDNYFGAAVKFLKTCMNEAYEEGLHTNQQHKGKRFVKVQIEVENVYLNHEQLEALAKLDLSENKKKERVRDMFLVGCWTGLRFSDFTNIQAKNIQGDFIEIKTQKTGEMVAIPIHDTVKEIMSRYAGITSNSLPPAISNAKLNEYIKEVAKDAGFDEMITLEKAVAGRKVFKSQPLHELVTTHTARRAFASNMFKMGVPTLVIMAITGHKTEKAFLKYIKVTPKEKAEIMREIWNRQTMKAVL